MLEFLGLAQLSEPILELINRSISTIVILLLMILFSSLVRKQIQKRLRDSGNVRMLAMLARNFVLLLGAMAIMFVWLGAGSDLAVALGIIGAGVAFASQEVIGSLAGYIIIVAGNLYRVGDRVEIGDVVGDIVDINMMRTTMMEIQAWVKADQYTGRIVTISNRSALTGAVYNYTKYNPYIWDEIVLPIPYTDNWRKAIELILTEGQEYSAEFQQDAQAAFDGLTRRYPIEASTVEPAVYLRMTDNWIELTLRYVVEAKKRRAVQELLYHDILELFEATPDVSVASATFEVVGLPEIRARVASGASSDEG